MAKYQPKDSFKSPRFCGVRTFMRLPAIEVLKDVDFLICGIPFDTAGSYRIGTRFGPQAIREVSVLLRPYNPNLDVDIYKYISGIDYGDVDIVPGYIEESYKKTEDFLAPVFSSQAVPIILGGDHSVTLPVLRAIRAARGPVALVHFDSHSDTWDSYFDKKFNHGTVFRRAVEEGCILPESTIQVGMRGPLYDPSDWKEAEKFGFEIITTAEIRKIGLENTALRIRERIKDNPVYVSFDIDFIDPAFAPGTGTPEVGGFSTWESLELVRTGLQGLDFVGFDLVEVLPAYDSGQITAFAAANTVFEFISLIANNHKRKR